MHSTIQTEIGIQKMSPLTFSNVVTASDPLPVSLGPARLRSVRLAGAAVAWQLVGFNTSRESHVIMFGRVKGQISARCLSVIHLIKPIEDTATAGSTAAVPCGECLCNHTTSYDTMW